MIGVIGVIGGEERGGKVREEVREEVWGGG